MVKLSPGFETKPLQDYCSAIIDCPHSTPPWFDSGKLVLRNFNIRNGRIDLSNPSYTDEATFRQRNARVKPKPGDLVISREAPMGEAAMIPRGIECCLGQRMVLLRPDPETCDSRYLLYALLSEYVQTQIKWNDVSGSIVSNLCIPDLAALRIPDYGIDTQRRTGAILSAIDDKIANNKKLIKELEETARLIYDYWFTQFDFPDENGKPYRSSGGKMVWSEEMKREVPVGWDVGTIGKSCAIKLGGTPDTSKGEYWGGEIPWLSSAEIASNPVLRSEKYITEKGIINSATEFSPAGSVALSITRYLRAAILAVDSCFNQSVVTLEENDLLKKEFIYPLIVSNIPRFIVLRTGAQQPHINKETVAETAFVIPPERILKKYYQMVSPLYMSFTVTAQEAELFSEIRDWLLPMLMNGQAVVTE